MKRFFTTLIFLLTLLPTFGDNQEVAIDENTSPKPSPRSIVQKPTVFVDDVQNTLSLKFTSQGEVYAVTIADETGFPIAQLQVVSDYVQQVYSLPAMSSGIYSIIIENTSRAFLGNFYM